MGFRNVPKVKPTNEKSLCKLWGLFLRSPPPYLEIQSLTIYLSIRFIYLSNLYKKYSIDDIKHIQIAAHAISIILSISIFLSNYLSIYPSNLYKKYSIDDIEHIQNAAHARWLNLDWRQASLGFALKMFIILEIYFS